MRIVIATFLVDKATVRAKAILVELGFRGAVG